MDLKEMNYGEIKKLLTTDDKGVAAQTLQEIHSAVLKVSICFLHFLTNN
jgi:hypothetical protein